MVVVCTSVDASIKRPLEKCFREAAQKGEIIIGIPIGRGGNTCYLHDQHGGGDYLVVAIRICEKGAQTGSILKFFLLTDQLLLYIVT